MANPRRITGPRDGIGFRAETFIIDGVTITVDANAAFGSAAAGRAVSLVTGTKDMVELTNTGTSVLGRLDHVEADGSCVVQIEGECKLPQGNAVTVVRGNKIVGALGASSARGYIGPGAADATTALAARHRVEDVTDPAAISVYLGV